MLGLEEKGLEELSKKDKIVGEFMEEIKKVNQDPIFIDWMSEEEDRQKLQNTLIHRAENRGKEENQKEMIKKLLSKNYTKEQISEMFDIPLDEINNIINI